LNLFATESRQGAAERRFGKLRHRRNVTLHAAARGATASSPPRAAGRDSGRFKGSATSNAALPSGGLAGRLAAATPSGPRLRRTRAPGRASSPPTSSKASRRTWTTPIEFRFVPVSWKQSKTHARVGRSLSSRGLRAGCVISGRKKTRPGRPRAGFIQRSNLPSLSATGRPSNS
jgi:hypothetical protein